jgi:hypothetical protein
VTSRTGLILCGLHLGVALAIAQSIPEGHGVPQTVREFLQGAEPDLGEIADFLALEPAPHWAGPGFDGVKDSVLSRLGRMRPLPPELPRMLADVVSNRSAERTGRMYSAQYLVEAYQRMASESQEWVSTNDALAVRRALYQALSDSDSMVQATALISLAELCRNRPELDKALVAAEALKAVQAPGSSPAYRAAAFRFCAQNRMVEALPAARLWAAKTGTAFVSLAALYALGEMGAGEDVENLRARLAERPYDEKRVAMLAAIQRIEQRQQSSPGRKG